jgi:dual specificity phosphatase 12
MDKVIDNLWIGSLAAALDPDLLHNNGITSILTVMRGRFAIPKVRE